MPSSSSGLRFNILLADVEHLDEAAVLFDQYRQFYGQPGNLPEARHFLFERLVNKESLIYLAKNGDEATVGFMQLYPTFSSISLEAEWILNDLYVLPDFRGNGIARGLIRTAQDLIRQRKDKGLSLSTAASNTAAQHLYETFGFERDTGFFHYHWRCNPV